MVPVETVLDGCVETVALIFVGIGLMVKTTLSLTVKPFPFTVIVNVTVPAVISATLGVYNVAPKLAFAKVPVPELVQAIVPFEAVPVVV